VKSVKFKLSWISALTLAGFMSTQSLAQPAGIQPAQNEQGEQVWSVNFNDTDIQEVIKIIAGVTGKTIIIDPKVRGPIKVINTRPLTAKEVYELFLASLDVNGFTAIESGNIVRIVANRDARNLPIPTEGGTIADGSKDDLYITQVIPLKYTSASKILAAIRPLSPQHAHMTVYEPSNAIILTDTRANAARMSDLIKQLDKIGSTNTDVVALRYANATDIVAMIAQLEKPDPARGIATAPPVIVADKRTNAVVISGDDLARQRIKLLIEDLDRPQARNSNIRVVYLNYAKAEDVAKVLTGMMQGLAPKAADPNSPNSVQPSVQADEATNSVLLSADVDTMDSLLSVIDSLDIRRAQVLIEAIIVEIQDSDGTDLGIEWMYRDDKYGFGSNTNDGAIGGVGAAAIAASDKNASQEDKDAALLNLAASASKITGQVFGFGRLGERTDFLGVLKMLQTNSSSNILSTPNLLTTDNTEASISVGQNVPFATGSYSGTSGNGGTSGGSGFSSPFNTFDRKDIGIILKVTPHLNEGNTVVLDIEQEVSSVADLNSASGLITNKREIKTQIMANDSQTVVLGGLIKDDVLKGEKRVPILGSIPVLGNLFRSQSSKKVKTNLLVFIRPTIVRDDRVLTGATAEKYRVIRDEQIEHRRQSGLLLRERDMPVIPDWETVNKPLYDLRDEKAPTNQDSQKDKEE
jgi:general secretion pathway protein D